MERQEQKYEPHESHAMINIVRTMGVTGDQLFESKVEPRCTMTLTIRHATVVDTDGHRWVHGSGKELAQVMMTPAQFAELITAIGTEGTPCTLTSFDGKTIRPPKKRPKTRVDHVQDQVKKKLAKIIDEEKQTLNKIAEILNGAKGLSQKKRDEVLSVFQTRVREVSDELPWMVAQLQEAGQEILHDLRMQVSAAESLHLIEKGSMDKLDTITSGQ